MLNILPISSTKKGISFINMMYNFQNQNETLAWNTVNVIHENKMQLELMVF